MATILSKKLKKKDDYKLSDLKTLSQNLLSSTSHINNLPLLLNFITPTSPPQYVLESLLSLQVFFTTHLPQLPPSSSSKLSIASQSKDDPEFIKNTWIRSKFDEFVKLLIDICISPLPEEALKAIVLDTIMEFVKLGNGGSFCSAIYHKLLHSIVYSTLQVEILVDLLAPKYFKYIDVCYFTYISLEKLARTLETNDNTEKKNASADDDGEIHSKASIELWIHKIHYILSHIPPLEGLDKNSDFDMWSGSEMQHKTQKSKNNVMSAAGIAKKMKLKFTKAWISFLRLPLPLDVYKEVLATLHQAVIPHLSEPIMLCDFLTRSYDIGGVISVMALSSLHILMLEYKLEYPKFYEKLYTLLTPSIFMAKHRAKFFQLLYLCLKSTHLPAYIAAAFAKKLSRLALSVPASGGLVIIALIHNLLRRHPSINHMVQWEVDGETATDLPGKKVGIDPFDNYESDLLKTRAMSSSLWEIDTIRHHYCPAVSRFVGILEVDLKVRSKTTEIEVKDFSSGSYATIFGEEFRRRVKQVPVASYATKPTTLFSGGDHFAGWIFSCEGSEEKKNGIDESAAKRRRVEG